MGQQKRERKLTGRTHCRPFAEQRDRASPREELAGCGRTSSARGRRQEGGERGKLGPKDRSPYRAANRPPVSNQTPPEILDGRHPPGGSWRDTGCWQGLGLGTRRGEGAPHRGECSRQAPGCLSRSDGEDAKSRRSFLFRAFVEHPRAGTAHSAGHAPYRAAGSLSSRRGESSTSPSLPRDRTSNPNKSQPPPASVRAEIRH